MLLDIGKFAVRKNLRRHILVLDAFIGQQRGRKIPAKIHII